MINLSPTSHEEFLKRRFPNRDFPVNFETETEEQEDDIMESRTGDSGGGNMSDFIKKDEFENFKTHLDSKFDRLIDKVDENRRELKGDMKHQTTVTISVISAIVTVIGVLVPVILHFI
ncbi:hypothetical protein [Staphylococcus pseudintermedius]|uniref:hypothetical protein n=1 Tax=Staphylococcus pseudintermedius TaxID=283734 RepID=UPI0019F19EB1|nr:hypothetical protein [Staphylococcus pseudintermedius]EGQ0356634.1 hypothetical protein [Staphylococcus pseudintermedius]EGQ3970040.1 hypothetical protein [Staphylococcus pseudintermedius]EHV5260386.1 hypothetical protein [Staphylococcus pseudintermedius]EJL8254426.1 hypothetical protein [Staphylococcus pseudintermedius]MDK3799300.1 hypothetical protein [Staphylococcus pseudintermedius]